MRLRIILGITIAISWLLYKWLPIESDLTRFLLCGLSLSIVSQLLTTGVNSLAYRHLLKPVLFKTQQGATTSSVYEGATTSRSLNQAAINAKSRFIEE